MSVRKQMPTVNLDPGVYHGAQACKDYIVLGIVQIGTSTWKLFYIYPSQDWRIRSATTGEMVALHPASEHEGA